MTTGGRGGPGQDEALSRFYQEVTERLAARFSADYDVEAGADRFQAWLRQQSQEHTADVAAIRPSGLTARPAKPASLSAGAALAASGGAVIAPSATGGSAGVFDELAVSWADPDADRTLTALFIAYYAPLVRLAVLLLGDTSSAEEIVQDSFAALHQAPRKPDSDSALSYLRQAVVTGSRSKLRHGMHVHGTKAGANPRRAGGDPYATPRPEDQAIISALRQLPARQREVIVLRFYSDLSEAQIAAAMRISKAAVKRQTAMAVAWLRAVLDDGNQ
jgi:RNA polymerase sigma factor (sigma-70 family)